jgi:hypothetical protein
MNGNINAATSKAGSSADLRVINNEGPTESAIQAIAEEQSKTDALIGQLRHAIHRVLIDVPTASEGTADDKRSQMPTYLAEALYCRLERQRELNAAIRELLERVRL